MIDIFSYYKDIYYETVGECSLRCNLNYKCELFHLAKPYGSKHINKVIDSLQSADDSIFTCLVCKQKESMSNAKQIIIKDVFRTMCDDDYCQIFSNCESILCKNESCLLDIKPNVLYHWLADESRLFHCSNLGKLVIPGNCSFLLSDANRLEILTNHCKNDIDFIVIDPPWPNKSVRRYSQYNTMSFKDISLLPIPFVARPGCILACWSTNSETVKQEIIERIFPMWGITYLTTYFWHKVTCSGADFIKPTRKGTVHKQNTEPIFIGVFLPLDISLYNELSMSKLTLKCVPSPVLHSWKPPLFDIFRKYLPASDSNNKLKCLEMFARSLHPGFISWGNEVLKFQQIGLSRFTDTMIDKRNHHLPARKCTKRPAYRSARNRQTAIRSYCFLQESRFLLVFNLPPLNLKDELLKMFNKFGTIEQCRYVDEYPESESDVLLIVFCQCLNARRAKRKLDEHNFYGVCLHVCYAPELESPSDVLCKWNERQEDVERRRKWADEFWSIAENRAFMNTKTAVKKKHCRRTDRPGFAVSESQQLIIKKEKTNNAMSDDCMEINSSYNDNTDDYSIKHAVDLLPFCMNDNEIEYLSTSSNRSEQIIQNKNIK
ncbi:hypothetical protein GJ496_005260 [Pomphorhynchus laevis]|nr:hypothetical protein GJ496_005260 [Pomphorhynchus laevis]